MTRNNLQEHLYWLVSSKPFAPPPPGSAPPASYFSATQEATSNDPLRVAPRGTTTFHPGQSHTARGDLDHVGKEFEFARPLLPASSYNIRNSEEMARLQSAPRSNTKRLLSRNSPDPLQTPTPYPGRRPSTSLKDQYTARYEHGNDGTSIRNSYCKP